MHYDVWGVPTIGLETVPQPLLYAGYWYDRELGMPGESTGWYWLSVRPYDPVLKRFLQPDPSGIEGLRSYVYVGDDPTGGMDPSGLCPAQHTFGPCTGKKVGNLGSVTEFYFSSRYPPPHHDKGRLYWSLLLPPGIAALGPTVTVSMPLADVNGRPINPPYAPHVGAPSYDYHGSMRTYTYLGPGGGTHPLKVGDRVEFLWNIVGPRGYGTILFGCMVTRLSA
jgi:RHS repeat-associated protein